jgi:aquaporin Z
MDRRKLEADFLGTFWLVLGGCGAAVLAAIVYGAVLGIPDDDIDRPVSGDPNAAVA